MLNKLTLSNLVNLAENNHRQGLKAQEYAVRAALIVTQAYASKYSAEAAKAASFVATASFIKLSGLSAQLIATEMSSDALISARPTIANNEQLNTNNAEFLQLSKDTQATFIEREKGSKELFQKRFAENLIEAHARALKAAEIHYIYAFSVTFSAYVHAASVAAAYSEDEKAVAFKKAFNARIEGAFLGEQIAPHFLMAVLTSEATKILAITLLVASLVVLAAGISALALPAVAVGIHSAVGVGGVALTASSASLATVSTGLIMGGFFANKRLLADQQKSYDATAPLLTY